MITVELVGGPADGARLNIPTMAASIVCPIEYRGQRYGNGDVYKPRPGQRRTVTTAFLLYDYQPPERTGA